MPEYEWCNNTINKTPKRDPKPHQKTPNYHPSIHSPKCQKNTYPQCKSLINNPASAFHPHNDWFAAGQLLVRFQLVKEPAAGEFTVWWWSCSQATSSSVTMLSSESAKRPRARFRMTSSYCCCLIISYRVNFWKPVSFVRKLLGFGRCISPSSSNSCLISLMISSAAGGRMSSRDRQLRSPCIGVWAPAVPSACWPRYTMPKSVGLLNFIAACTHPAAVLLSKIGVILRVYRPPSSLGPCRQPQSAQLLQLESGRPAIAAFTIYKMVISTIDVTIGRIYSSSPGQCHENSWELFSPTLLPAMSGST